MYSSMSLTQNNECSLNIPLNNPVLKAANAVDETNLLTSTIKTESNIWGYWFINNDICYLCQLEPIGDKTLPNDIISCKTVKDFCKEWMGRVLDGKLREGIGGEGGKTAVDV